MPRFAAVCLLAAAAAAQDVKVEKYTLPNGMDVILHEDHSLPIACVNVWYKVGSKDEAPGRSGFAHLFEHLMFMGTKRVPGSQFDELMEGFGGSNNASTSNDRTNYFSSGPSSLLPMLLWLEADRLEHLGVAMTQEKLDKQREVVRNERRQTTEMTPYGRSEEKTGEFLYPAGHPYHKSVIGSHEDLEAATLRDVTDFFARYYVPNNASLVVAGDFDPKEIKPLVERWFATLPRGPELPLPRRPAMEAATIEGQRLVEMTDSVQFARTSLVWLSPPAYREGDAEMDLLAAILTEGKSSRLYKRLVYDDKAAVDVAAYQDSMILGSQFHIVATAKPGVSLDTLEKAIDEELAKLVKDGMTAAELDRVKAQHEARTLQRLQSLLTRADMLNLYNFHWGEPNGFRRDLERYRRAEADDIQQMAKDLLQPRNRLVLRVTPGPKEAAQGPRDARPEVAGAKDFAPQQPESFKLNNGLEVRHWRRSELPLVAATLFLRGGTAEDGEAAGRTALMADMLSEGAGDLGALAFGDALAALGATVDGSADQHSVRVSLSALKTKLAPALQLWADAIRRPRFEPREWERVKTLHLQRLRQREDDPVQVARIVGSLAWFGEGHPYARPVDGVAATVERLDIGALEARFRQVVRPERATVFLAGDLTAAEAKTALESVLGDWSAAPGTAEPAMAAIPAPQPAGRRVVVVDKPDAVQTVVRLMMPGPAYTDPRRETLLALNTLLGGSFTSRLNANLREKHGYTYGVRSDFVMWPGLGVAVAATSVQDKVTGAALKELLGEIDRLRGGDVSPADADKARATNRQTLVASLESLQGLLGGAVQLELNGLPFTALAQRMQAIDTLDAPAMNAQARQALPVESALLVLVGNKSLVLEQIRDLGWPTPEERDRQGRLAPSR